MKKISTINEFRKWRKNISGSIGFVPTMGALHEGHLSLVSNSNNICENTIVSIYINPTQFAEGEDLDTYPKKVQADLEKLSNYKVDCVFLPGNSEMYPEGINTGNYENNLFGLLEGKSRPGFFKGVTTIVAILFDIVEPTHAFFGMKDFQQFCIIKKMVEELNYPIQVVPCPIIREENGLAMSSRNKLLKDDEINVEKLKREITRFIKSEPQFKIDYVSVASGDTLEEFEGELSGDILVSVAVFLGKTRLIDNFPYSVSDLYNC